METPLLSSVILGKLLLLRSRPPSLENLVPKPGFEISGTVTVTEIVSQWVRQMLLKHVLKTGHSLPPLWITSFSAAGATTAPKLRSALGRGSQDLNRLHN